MAPELPEWCVFEDETGEVGEQNNLTGDFIEEVTNILLYSNSS